MQTIAVNPAVNAPKELYIFRGTFNSSWESSYGMRMVNISDPGGAVTPPGIQEHKESRTFLHFGDKKYVGQRTFKVFWPFDMRPFAIIASHAASLAIYAHTVDFDPDLLTWSNQPSIAGLPFLKVNTPMTFTSGPSSVAAVTSFSWTTRIDIGESNISDTIYALSMRAEVSGLSDGSSGFSEEVSYARDQPTLIISGLTPAS